MAQAKKLPSGSWRIRVTDSETGKRVSFTADTKNEAELMALEFLNGKRKKPTAEKTLEELMLSYIDSKSNIRFLPGAPILKWLYIAVFSVYSLIFLLSVKLHNSIEANTIYIDCYTFS